MPNVQDQGTTGRGLHSREKYSYKHGEEKAEQAKTRVVQYVVKEREKERGGGNRMECTRVRDGQVTRGTINSNFFQG